MAEEVNDLIEKSNDEMENWIYYNGENKTQESGDMNTFCEVDADQLIYMNCNNLMNDTEPAMQYDECDDNSLEDDGEGEVQNMMENGNEIETNTQQTQNNVDEESEHNIVLKETIDENGQLVEQYFCQQCNFSFNTIEDFLNAHSYLGMLNENAEKEPIQQNEIEETPTMVENKLWELVEIVEDENDDQDDNIIELKPDMHDDSSDEKECANNSFEADKEHYFCYDCQQIFTDLTTAENHDCSSPTLISNDCSESNSTPLVDDDNVYSCHLCDKDYTSFRSFTNHQRWHKKSDNSVGHVKTSNSAPVICEICNTIFASEKNLKLHMKMHKKQTVRTIQDALPVGAQEEYNDLNRFFCEICNKSFDQNLLGIHKNMHQNLEEHTCTKCNKKFENLPSYEIHMQMHVDNFRNGKAGKTFALTNSAETASASTTAKVFADGGKRKHACQYCGKEFQRPYEKVKHERIHTGEKPYECEVCGKTFRVSYSLTLHLRTHTDIRPYVCATCNKRFKQQSVYVHHLKTHAVECAYKCDVCGKSFRTSVQLSGHKNIHSKPYNCTECNRPFASLYAVKIHMKTHNKCHKSNKNLKNRCSICGASYARVFALSLHIKEQHGIDVDPIRMLAASSSSNAITQNKLDGQTDQDSVDHQIGFINVHDEEDIESNEVNNEDDGVYVSQVDHEENIQNVLQSNVYIDETEAATQTILNTGEISVDDFPAEEIITDWLTK